MRLLFAGTPEVAVPTLEALSAAGHELVGVLTRAPAPTGRGRKLVASPVQQWAEKVGVPVFTPRHPRDEEFVATVTQLAPDACPVVAYGALLPQSLLDIPKFGWINLHFSLLPKWRGAAPLQRSIIAGDQHVGVSIFEIVQELDAGPIYRQGSVPLPELATADEMLDELAHFGAGMFVETLAGVAAGERPTPQDPAQATFAPKLTVDEARIDWAAAATQIHNHVRGFSPHPGAWTTLADARLKVLRTAPTDLIAELAPGQLHVTKRQVFVGTGDGTLELVSVQAVGKRPMPAADWARGGISNGSVLR